MNEDGHIWTMVWQPVSRSVFSMHQRGFFNYILSFSQPRRFVWCRSCLHQGEMAITEIPVKKVIIVCMHEEQINLLRKKETLCCIWCWQVMKI